MFSFLGVFFFFFSSRRRHTRFSRDWSSDVCSSDLVDQNSDGVINDMDKVNLGDPFPHYNFSVNLDLGYKGWDFTVLGQGVGQRTGRLNGMEGYPVMMDGSSNSLGTPREFYMENRWTPQTPDSRFPRVWTGSSSNAVLSDVWLSEAAFFRIKTIQLGYSIPKLGNRSEEHT